MVKLILKNGLALAAFTSLMAGSGTIAQATTSAKAKIVKPVLKVAFNPVAFTDSKGHYHPDWYFATLPTSNKRLGFPMVSVAPYALTGRVHRGPFNPTLYTDSKGHYHPDWAIHGRP